MIAVYDADQQSLAAVFGDGTTKERQEAAHSGMTQGRPECSAG